MRKPPALLVADQVREKARARQEEVQQETHGRRRQAPYRVLSFAKWTTCDASTAQLEPCSTKAASTTYSSASPAFLADTSVNGI